MPIEIGIFLGMQKTGGAAPAPVIPEFGVSSNNSGANNYVRTATLPQKYPLTIGGRVKLENTRGTYSGFAALNKSGDELFYCGTKIDGATLDTYFGVGNAGDGPTLVDEAWNYIVYTFGPDELDVPECKIYFNGALFTTVPNVQAPDAAVSLTLLTTDFGSWFSGAVQGMFVSESVWTAEQVAANVDHIAPLAPVWAWWLLDGPNDVTDRSGNGRHLTKVGTPVAVAGPGVPL